MQISVEIYRPHHRRIINDWLSGHGLPWVKPDELPTIGFVASVEDIPTAAGFLRACEGRTAIFDSLITSPMATSDARNRSIQLIVEKILDVAKICKFKKILALSVDKNTIARAIAQGFEEKELTVLTLNLSEGD